MAGLELLKYYRDLISLSGVGNKLLEGATADNVTLVLTKPNEPLKPQSTHALYIPEDKKIIIYEGAGFDSLSHELAHHFQDISPYQFTSPKEYLLALLLYEADAHAVQAIVSIEVAENLPQDADEETFTEVKKALSAFGLHFSKIRKGVSDDEKKLLARAVFTTYLENLDHLEDYVTLKRHSNLPFYSLAASFYLGVDSIIKVSGSQFGVAFTFAACSGWFALKQFREIGSRPNVNNIISQLNIGNLPGINGDYFEGKILGDSLINPLLKKVDNSIQAALPGWKKLLFDKVDHIQSKAHSFRAPK